MIGFLKFIHILSQQRKGTITKRHSAKDVFPPIFMLNNRRLTEESNLSDMYLFGHDTGIVKSEFLTARVQYNHYYPRGGVCCAVSSNTIGTL